MAPPGQPDVVVVRGAPGVGKSTLARRLKGLRVVGAVVEVDDVRAMIAGTDWTDRHQHDAALEAALGMAAAFVASGLSPILLVDTFSRGRLRRVQAYLDEAALGHRTFSLWLDPGVLRERLACRPSGFREWEPTEVLNREVASNRYPDETFLDVTGLDKEAVAAVVAGRVGAGDRGAEVER